MDRSRTGRVIMPAWQNRHPRVQPLRDAVDEEVGYRELAEIPGGDFLTRPLEAAPVDHPPPRAFASSMIVATVWSLGHRGLKCLWLLGRSRPSVSA